MFADMGVYSYVDPNHYALGSADEMAEEVCSCWHLFARHHHYDIRDSPYSCCRFREKSA